jgi:hypothetical protein
MAVYDFGMRGCRCGLIRIMGEMRPVDQCNWRLDEQGRNRIKGFAPYNGLFGVEKEDIAFENSYLWNINP